MAAHSPNSHRQMRYVGVIGGSTAPTAMLTLAHAVGGEIARRGGVLICGGLGGIMQAAARGAQEAGGVVIGILPGPDRLQGNPYLTYSIVTNLGHARNMLIAHSADGLIAVAGSYGTISEAAIALKLGKPVIGLATAWELPGMLTATAAAEAVDRLWQEMIVAG
ncbi:MAG: TIGR00725 family protein [Desulfobacca sp.]|uniref:TIGR00725 family protein n=1 Tax=Desulfobacca sp. TaxID=2067990 RepID=UPI00404A7349